jgi:hypothetical protein
VAELERLKTEQIERAAEEQRRQLEHEFAEAERLRQEAIVAEARRVQELEDARLLPVRHAAEKLANCKQPLPADLKSAMAIHRFVDGLDDSEYVQELSLQLVFLYHLAEIDLWFPPCNPDQNWRSDFGRRCLAQVMTARQHTLARELSTTLQRSEMYDFDLLTE